MIEDLRLPIVPHATRLSVLLLCLMLASSLGASGPERPAVMAAPAGSERIVVDGRLDEAIWLAAPAVSELVQRQPVEGAIASEKTEVRIHEDGWTAEMEIPWSQLRFNRSDEIVFGMNVRRSIPSRNEEAYWVLVPRQEVGWASRFGDLRGIRDIETSRRVELLPYASHGTELAGSVDPADPFRSEQENKTRFGGDLKMGLGPNLTLEGTLNPDFGQVEADPAVINLSAFETTFSERRPFFVEGASLLRGRGPAWFYSRRIGQQPRVPVPGDFIAYRRFCRTRATPAASTGISGSEAAATRSVVTRGGVWSKGNLRQSSGCSGRAHATISVPMPSTSRSIRPVTHCPVTRRL